MGLFRRKPKLSMIDLHKYEHDCMRWKRKRFPMMPPPVGYDNDKEAYEIYEYYKNARHTEP